MTNLNLYELIKQKSKERGRKLKIVCDWDDCLQPIKPKVIHIESKSKIPFKDFFKEFWEISDMSSSSTGAGLWKNYKGGNSEVEKTVKGFLDRRKEKDEPINLNAYLKRNYKNGFYKETPFLSLADDLLQASKEELFSELVIITSYWTASITEKQEGSSDELIDVFVKEKAEKIKNTFCGPACHATFELTPQTKDSDGRLHPHRWEVMRDKFPDFDMYIDDNDSLVANSPSTLKFMNQIPNIKDKIFVLNDYKSNRKTTGPNIYHIKTEVSNLNDKDFEIAALEMRLAELEKEFKKKKKPRDEKPLTAAQHLLNFCYWHRSCFTWNGYLLVG